MAYENIRVEVEGSVAQVTVDRPKVLNALNQETVAELTDAALALEKNAAVRVVILTGSGEKAFVAGADIAAMKAMGVMQARAFAQAGDLLMGCIESSTRPWIAAVNGFALGGGCELALACDFIYGSKNARLGQPEVNLGVIPGFGGTQRLLRRVGIAKARELVYTGEMVGAEEALRIGLLDQVVDPAELLPRAKKTADTIAKKGPLAIAAAKRVLQQGQSMNLADGCFLEALSFAALFSTEDQTEGMQAFLEKRSPKFEGK